MSQSSEMLATTARSLPRAWRLYPALLQRLMRAMRRGRLVCITPEGEQYEHRAALPGPAAVLHLHHWRALRALVLGGDTGLAQSYIAGDWTSPDLAAFLTWAADPNLDSRKEIGLRATLFLIFLTILAIATKRKIWRQSV